MSSLRRFYLILFTQSISQIGSQMTGLAIGIWLFQTTGDVTPLALVSFFSLLTNVLFANVAGLVADRVNRRLLMSLADSGSALGSFILMLLFFSGGFQIWHLYVLTVFTEICRSFQGPAFTATASLMVPDAQRDRANAVMQMAGPLGGILAPALTAAVYGLGGITTVLLVDLVTFVLAITTMFFSKIPQPPRTESGAPRSLLYDLTVGFRFFLKHKPFLVMLIFTASVNFVGTGFGVLQTPYILSRTGNDTVLLGVLLAAANIGAVSGGLIMAAWGGTRPRVHTVMPSLILLGVMLGLFGMAQTPLMLGLTMFLFMMMPMFANIPLMSMMQAKVPPDQQGRVFAAVGQVALVVSPISTLLVGPLADNVFEPAASSAAWAFSGWVGSGAGAGMGLMIALAGLAIALMAAFAYTLPMIRHLESRVPDWQTEAAPGSAEA